MSDVEETWDLVEKLMKDVPALVLQYCQLKAKDPVMQKMSKALKIPLRKGGVADATST